MFNKYVFLFLAACAQFNTIDAIKTINHQTQTTLHPKNHQCPKCPQTCTSPYTLTIHMRVHTKERPFVCNRCDKRFTQKSNLTKHKQIHSEEKPYACDICNQGFVQNIGLKKHQNSKKHIEALKKYLEQTEKPESLYASSNNNYLSEPSLAVSINTKKSETNMWEEWLE